MPDIQLIPWGNECAASEGTIKLLILSYMLFPNEEEKRKGFLALLGSQAREHWRTAQPEQVAQWVADRAEAEISDPLPPERIEAARDRLKEGVTVDFQDFFGGADAIGLLPPKAKLLQEMRGGYQNWLRVGIMFRLLVDFHHYYDHRATLADIFPVFTKHPALAPLREGLWWYEDKNLYAFWDRYKRVGHFCAAFSCLAVRDYSHCLQWKRVGIEPFTTQHKVITLSQFFAPAEGASSPLNFLGCAQEFQRFGRLYKPKQSSHPLIPESAWLIPEGWNLPSSGLPKNIPPHSFRCIFERNARTLAA